MKTILKQKEVDQMLAKMAEQIEKAGSLENLAIIGIRQGGTYLSEQLQKALSKGSKHDVARGLIDINLYRDDIGMRQEQPIVRATEIDFLLDGKRVVLVDDVLFTGRTIRAALSALIDLGRPLKVELAVLIDRGYRELPIAADYVGREVKSKRQQLVKLINNQNEWQVVLKDAAK